VVNEMKILAQLKEIPVISVAHLNRDASKTIDEGTRGNKADLTRALGRANVGESMLMIDNADWVTIVNTEYDQDGNKFMAFKNVKMRYAAMVRDCIFYPFEKDNGLRLIEDLFLLSPVFRDTIAANKVPVQQLNRTINMKPSMYNNLTQMEDDEDNIFTPNGSTYSSNISINMAPQAPRTIIPMSAVKTASGAMPIVIFYNEGEEDLYQVVR
jgi:hypothetical protein